ncbi:MAG: biliverdin-producing heme oxygenase [Acidimicrobiia bacterium]|nr:biliverdin-producing heme oxygenase [Acidimicrobiia bacterium]
MTDTQTAPTGLAARLREATTPEHRDTETRGFVTKLMSGELDLDAYVRYLAQYAYVYRALEARLPRPGDPAFLNVPALPRFSAIVSDLEQLGAPDWETSHPPLDATAAYVDHVLAIDDADLPRTVAHHYTRYLGDLSGGQAIAKRVADHYGATEDQLAFYRFDVRPGPFKVAYRQGLDDLGFTPDEEAVLFAEAKQAFRLNADLFEALDAAQPAAR